VPAKLNLGHCTPKGVGAEFSTRTSAAPELRLRKPHQTQGSWLLLIRRVLEAAGVEFIDENGGGPGVRLRTRQQEQG
jgi:hypothetical protein